MRNDNDYPFKDLSTSDLAKDHIRHMIGGRAKQVPDELVFRLHFVDRPNSLLELLRVISSKWNISLFHFRSHGADFNRALLGIQVPHADKKELVQKLKTRVLFIKEETKNPPPLLCCLQKNASVRASRMVRPLLFPIIITMMRFGRRFSLGSLSLSRLVFSSNKNATTTMMMFCLLFVSPKGNDLRVRMLTRRISLSSFAHT